MHTVGGAFDGIYVNTYWVHSRCSLVSQDIVTQRSPYYDGRLMSGAMGEPVTHGYAYLVARGKIGVYMDAAFGSARERGVRGGARHARQ